MDLASIIALHLYHLKLKELPNKGIFVGIPANHQNTSIGMNPVSTTVLIHWRQKFKGPHNSGTSVGIRAPKLIFYTGMDLA